MASEVCDAACSACQRSQRHGQQCSTFFLSIAHRIFVAAAQHLSAALEHQCILHPSHQHQHYTKGATHTPNRKK